MATKKISELPIAQSLTSTDVLPSVNGSTTKQITVLNLANSLTAVTQSLTASFVTGSIHTSANPALSASYAISASYVPSSNSFPFSGSAVISGSLIISGSPGVELTVLGDTQFTGSVSSRGGFTGSLSGSLVGTAETASLVTHTNLSGGTIAIAGWNGITSNPSRLGYASVSTGTTKLTYSTTTEVLNATASYATTASYINDLNQNLTITGSVIISGSPNPEIKVIGDMIVTGSLIVSGNNGAGVFSQGATLVDYTSTITSTGSYMVWRAPFSCSVVALYGWYVGGTAPQVNAFRSGSSGNGRITGSNVLVNQENVWIPATASLLQNTNFNAGDSLMIILSGSSNNQLAAQVDFIKKF